MSDDDEAAPQLSAETFLALQEFYDEQQAKSSENTNNVFNENWQLSQFWYDEATVDTLVEITLNNITPNGKIGLISCPTLYKPIKERIIGDTAEVHLFEYDKRFSLYGDDFIFYDYTMPLDVPKSKANYYDLIIADPPFLSEECLIKTAVTIKFLTKNNILLCTGATMEELVGRLLHLTKTSFIPRHKNNLANEFHCYSNFPIGD